MLIDYLQPTVICFQETKLQPLESFTLKHYDLYRLDKNTQPNEHAKGGVAPTFN